MPTYNFISVLQSNTAVEKRCFIKNTRTSCFTANAMNKKKATVNNAA